MALPRTTICLKSYNRLDLVLEAIESSELQSVRPKVLLIDDGSDPAIRKSLRLLRRESAFYKYVELKLNRGPAHLNNLAISLVESPFLAFLDSDDLLHPCFVEEMENALDTNSWADFAYCRFEGGPKWSLEGEAIFHDVLKQGHMSALGTLFGRSVAFKKLQPLPTRESIGMAADACDDDRLSFEIARGFGVVHVPRELYIYRDGGNDRLTKNPILMLSAWTRLLNDYRGDYLKMGLGKSLGAHFCRNYIQFSPSSRHAFHFLFSQVLSGLPRSSYASVISGYLIEFLTIVWGELLRVVKETTATILVNLMRGMPNFTSKT